MAHVLIMPRQGNTVESCIIVDWKVKEGDAVSADTTVCEVETDKAAFDVPAGAEGSVLKILHAAGDDVPVLEAIAVIGGAGEDWAAALGRAETGGTAPGDTANTAVPASVPAPVKGAAPSGSAAGEGRASPRARNLAAKEGLPLAGLGGSGPGGRIIERDVAVALKQRPPLSAAAKAAGGVVPAAGSGLGRRVTLADLAGGAAADAVLPASGEGAIIDTPIKGIRKLIADRMYQSLAESAQFTLNGGASAVRMQELRSRMKVSGKDLGLAKITVNDLILFAVSRLLPLFPFMNAHKTGDILRTFERVHLGVAVDTPKGLMVPVIDRKSTRL
ncbi:MAG: 2-oxo acid dehydrogenase subunit E2, partial [Treponema sp.]|nr:2-oxo acid dehydrogenase subunit E2 [Treponema sp.]